MPRRRSASHSTAPAGSTRRRWTAGDVRELTGRPLRERRARLETAVSGGDLVLPVRRLAKNGFEAWAEAIAHDYEGLVAKDETSLYEAGPTRCWLKVKQKDWTVEEDWWQRRISARA